MADPVYANDILISPENPVIELGKSVQFSALVLPENAINKAVKWTSDNATFAHAQRVSIDNNGLATGVSVGKGYVGVYTSMSTNRISRSVEVEVVNPEGAVLVRKIVINPDSLTLGIGEEAKLTTIVTPSNATCKTIFWNVPQGAVASVDRDGNVIARREGTSYIIAKSADGNAQARITVTVGETIVHVNGVKLSAPTIYLRLNQTAKLVATVTPSNATNKKVIWSNDTSVVCRVDQEGNVTAMRVGVGSVVVKTEDGGFMTSCSVVVTPDSQPTPDPDDQEPPTPSGDDDIPAIPDTPDVPDTPDEPYVPDIPVIPETQEIEAFGTCSAVTIKCENTGVSASVVRKGGFNVTYSIEQITKANDIDVEVSSKNSISVGVQPLNTGVTVSVHLVCFVNPDTNVSTYLAVTEGFVKTSNGEFIVVLL